MTSIRSATEAVDPARRQALWNEPRAVTLLDIVERPAARYGSLPAIFLSPDGRVCEPLSWEKLWNAAVAQAGLLTEGIERGQPVLLAAPTSESFFTAFFGIIAAGGVPVPVATPPSLQPSRLDSYRALLANIASHASAEIILTTSRYQPTLEACVSGAARLRVLVADAPSDWSAATELRRPDIDDLALLQYTSGSTSRPKAVALTHKNIIANARIIAEALAFPDTAGVSWLPLFHDMGLIGAALTGMYARTPLLLLPTSAFGRDPAAWLRAISAFQGTITLAPNFAYGHVLRHVTPEQLAGVSLASVRTMLNGAEPIDATVVAEFEQRFACLGLKPGVVRPVYGLAESVLAVTFADEAEQMTDEVDADALEQNGVAQHAAPNTRRRRFMSVGRPLPTQDVRIANERGRSLPDRRIGEVVVRGPSVMQGYYKRPAETQAVLRDGWLRTGDLGYMADGRLYLTGRLKDLIIRHGRNYYPSDIEHVVGNTDGVLRGAAAVFGIDEQPGVSRVIVVAETRLRRSGELAELARRIRERCHDAFLFGPDEVQLVQAGAIPRTTSGKVRRSECRRLYAAAAFRFVTEPSASFSMADEQV